MDCQKIKDLILTDYLDNELSNEWKAQVEAHLKQCAACQAFAQEVRMNINTPLEEFKRQEVPAQIWMNIKEEIEQKPKLAKGWLFGFPRFVPVLASFVLVLLVSTSIVINQQVTQVKNQEAGLYIDTLMTSLDASSSDDSSDYGTAIESYFL